MENSAGGKKKRGVTGPDAAEVDLFLSLGVSEEGWSPRTRMAYQRDLELYLGFLNQVAGKSLAASRAETILDFLSQRRLVGDAERTLNRRLASLRTFHKHLIREKILKVDPLSRLPSPKRPKNLPKYLSTKEVEALFAALEGSTPRTLRDRAIVELLYATGMRVSELCELKEGDLSRGQDFDSIKVLGKGGKERFIPIHDRALKAIQAWRTRGRPKLLQADFCPQLFISSRGRALGRVAIYKRLRSLGLEAGIRQRVTPHLLRHSFATHLIHEGADLRSVQEMLGHANLETTTIYTSVDAQRLKAVHERHHPRS